MADIVISIGAKVAEGFVKPTIRQGQYFFSVRKVAKNLVNEKNELISERGNIQSLVEQAKERTEIVENYVEKWLDDVKNLLLEVEILEQKFNENHFRQGQFPTWRRYRLCKEMMNKIKRITYLKNNCKFEPFSHLSPLPGIEYISSLNFTYFESTKEAYNQVMEAIQEDNTCMIGLYGMGGSGKTNLVKEVGKKALQLKLCDRVIFVTVSQKPNIRGIQGKIADMLCLPLKEETEEGRAQRLWLRLKEEKRVLLIVDDVWAKLNLESIGILLDENNMLNLKVLLTTRLRQVCASMECQREIVLNLLSEGEAWTLFQKHARIDDRFPSNLLKVALEVSNETKGLPIAIEAVACSLKGKCDDEWKVALESLRGSEPFDHYDGEGVRCAYNCLKLSFDYLRNKEAEMLLLLCSLFPEDHEIYLEDLIKYGVGLGICGTLNSFDLARSRIKAGINKLVDSCLLFHSTQSADYVRMHDMVRDVALWIASKSMHHKIMVDLPKDLNSLVENGAMKDSFALSSWCKETGTIYPLDAPKLEILLINTMQENSLNFMLASFERVKGLKVMSMINSFYRTPLLLPQSTHCLTNLRTLHLRGWNLGDMSFIVSLTRLEILDLSNCYFRDLPKGMDKLNKLKLLDLSHYEIPEDLNYEAIGSCLQLEELYAFGYTQRCHCQQIEDIVTLPNLQRFVICLGQFETLVNEESERVLHLPDFSMSNIGASKQNLLQRAEVVWLKNLLGDCKNIIPDMVQIVGGMAELTKLSLQSCKEIDCFIDTTYHYAALFQADSLLPKMIELKLSEMDKLTEVCRGPPLLALGFFKKLERLFIQNCKQLYNIFPDTCNLCNLKVLKIWNRHSSAIASLFSMSVARSMEQLEELWIQGCEKLKHIIAGERGDGTNTGENSHSMFNKLKKLSICDCPKLEFIFPISFVKNGLLQLHEIEIESASELKYVFGQYDHVENDSHHNQVQIMLPPLKVFCLYKVENLLGLCPESYHLGFPSLEELDCQQCPKLTASCITVTIGSEQRPMNNVVALDNDQQNCLTSNLQQLLLGGLYELRFIWSGTSSGRVLSFRFLQCLKVDSCANLKSIFSTAIKRSLPELTFLSICNCEELEEIMAENAEPASLSNVEVCFPKLSELKIEKCNKLKSLFSVAMLRMLPQLSFIHISCAAQLEEAFRHSSQDNRDYKDRIMLPELRKLELQKLPCLGNIFKGFNFQTPKVQQLYVKMCSNFAPSVTTRIQVNNFQNTIERRQVFWLIVAASNLEAFLNLEVLHVNKSGEEVIFQIQASGELCSNSELNQLNSNLGYLTLYDLPELKFIWNGFSKFLSLDKLTHVSIQKCPKVKTIFSSAFVRCLPKLQTLSISNCEELEEIMSLDSEVSKHGGSENKSGSQDHIILPDLRKIELKKLPSFVNIFHGFHFQTPKLQHIHINIVPKFGQRRTHVNTHDHSKERQIFWLITATSNEQWQRHRAALQASLNLEVLHVSMCEVEGIFQGEGELGCHSELKPMKSNLEYLKLYDLLELRFIWRGLTNFLSLEKLTRVSISNCPKLKTICSPSIVRCLPKLHSMRISNCAELIEIMSSNSINPQLNQPYVCHQQEVCFPQLCQITVEQCNKLKCLFYDFMANHFPKLQSLEIKECYQIEQILGFKAKDEDGKQILFPQLTRLVLQSLPMFFEISPGFTLAPGFNLHPWHEYIVLDCPKYNRSYPEASTSYLNTIPQAQGVSQASVNQDKSLGLELSWNPPNKGWVTINVEGAFDNMKQVASCGGLIRDHNGKFIHGFMHHIGIGDSLNAQLWACLMGLRGAWDAGFHRAILETSSQQIVRMFEKDMEERYLDAEEGLVHQIHSMLNWNWKIRVVHCQPKGNMVADMLANLALQAWPGYHFFHHPPKQVEKLVKKEGGKKPFLM